MCSGYGPKSDKLYTLMHEGSDRGRVCGGDVTTRATVYDPSSMVRPGGISLNENEKPLELFQLLNLPEAALADERLRRWAEAFQAWMEERRARFCPTTGRGSYNAWREFLTLTRKPPWEATVADVEAYAETLQKRKLRPATIFDRLSRLAQFYAYCQANGIDAECGAGFNPAAGVRKPKIERYQTANYLSQKEESALLEAIRRDPSQTGKRDYALILMLLRTGWRAGEVRQLRWEGIGDTGNGDKGGLVEEVWEAVREYLEASGRWEGIQAEEYVFAPSRAPLRREAREQPDDWDGSRPLSKSGLLKVLKLRAGHAGLKAEKITTRTLRHTAVMRRVEAGEPIEALQAMLGKVPADKMKHYLRRLAEKPKGRLRARKWIDPETGELVQPGADEIPSHAPCSAQPRNHLALTHGFYAKYLPEFEWLAEDGIEPQGMDRAILRWRIVMRRILIVGDGVQTLEEAMHYLKLTGLASVRLVKALKYRQLLRDLQVKLQWEAFFRERR